MGGKPRHRLIRIQVVVQGARSHGGLKERNNVHIILVSDRLATAKSINLGWRHLAVAAVGFISLVLLTSSLFSYLTVRHAVELRLPFVEEMLGAKSAAESQRSKEFVRENLNAMAIKLGQMQAQLTRLDLLGERLAVLSGVKSMAVDASAKGEADPLNKVVKDGRGGPLVQATPLSQADLLNALDALSLQVESRGDTLAMIESQLLDKRNRKNMLPTTLPVTGQWSSNFGWRIDPFTGDRAMHEGVDFPAEIGTAVNAAAGGMVISAENHPEYGNFIEIDHGNDLTTRYAHLSRILVKPGALVRRGQRIGEVGSTGRSTGAHLHFEVRLHGAAQNPGRFLQSAENGNGADVKLSLARRR